MERKKYVDTVQSWLCKISHVTHGNIRTKYIHPKYLSVEDLPVRHLEVSHSFGSLSLFSHLPTLQVLVPQTEASRSSYSTTSSNRLTGQRQQHWWIDSKFSVTLENQNIIQSDFFYWNEKYVLGMLTGNEIRCI